MTKAEPGDFIWSNYFNRWLEIVQILPDGHFYFKAKFGSRVPTRSQTPISYFEQRGWVRKVDKRKQ